MIPPCCAVVVDQMGANRVAMGTDYPFPLGELVPGELINSMPYDGATKQTLLGGAALEWLGKQHELFR
jgi:aminocarboxymuconate-semialdehyde decarboxylase